MRRIALPFAVWIVFGICLAGITARVVDWFVMTDELLYERLALSVVRLHSPIPHVHDIVVGNLNQLYPLVIAPAFATGTVAHGVYVAHIINAFVVTSAAVPAYLLALRVTRNAWASTLAAVLTVIVPWVVLASFLLTSVVAYPAFVWALLAFHIALATPTRRNDALAAAALGLAVVARTQFVVLGVVLLIMAARRWREHRVLVGVFAVAGATAMLLVALGHSPLGTYGETVTGNPLPLEIVPAFFSHLAAVAVGLGLIPFVVGGAWLVRRDLFAQLATTTIVLLTLEVASFDIRFGGGVVRDRYIFYLAPLFAIAFAAALASWRSPRWTLAAPFALLLIGFAAAPLPVYEKLYADTPVSIIDGYLRRELGGLTGARSFLIVATALAVVLVLEAGVLLGRGAVVTLAACAVLLTAAETGYAFERLFRIDGTAGRPLTADPSADLAWIDRAVGRDAHVTMLPFPTNAGDYWASAAYWWDVEFWNASVDGSAGVPGTFEWTPSTFPKLALRFDGRGRASLSRPGDVLQAVGDTRFHLAGKVVTNNRGVFLVEPELPWRADWSTRGLYDDGWTRPAAKAFIVVYPYPGQDRSVQRTLTVSMFAPAGASTRAVKVGGTAAVAGTDEISADATVCVAPGRSGVAEVTAEGSSSIYGDPATDLTFAHPRGAGVQISRIYLSGQIGPDC